MSLLQSVRFALRTARLGEAPKWSPERTQRMARRRLRRLVRFAAANSPHFARKYAGLDLNRVSLADLPPLTKQEVRENFDACLTDRRVNQETVDLFLSNSDNVGRWLLGKYAVSHTSGSQGTPLVIVQDRRALEILFGMMSARANGHKPSVFEALRRLRSPARLAIVAQHRGFYPSAAAFEFMSEFTRPFTRIQWFSSLDPDLGDKLNTFQPNLLVGYASVLEGLAMRGDLQFKNLRQIANSSEQLTEPARRRIEAALGVPVLDHYGTGECLFLSDGCRTDGGAHVNCDWALLEVVDENNMPVPPGEPGKKVLITNLANRIQPFIRYEVGDQVVMADEPCQCGSRLPRIARIEGRSADLFWVRDARGAGYRMLPGVLFHSAADSLGEVRQWRAVQTERNEIEFQVELLSDDQEVCDQLGQRLIESLQTYGLPENVRVVVEQVIGLMPDPHTGKFRRMVSQIGPPTELDQPQERALAG